jgi:hypothetical protein
MSITLLKITVALVCKGVLQRDCYYPLRMLGTDVFYGMCFPGKIRARMKANELM